MATLNYFVSAKKIKPAPIYIRFSAGRGHDIIIRSGLIVDPDRWSNKKQSVKLYNESDRSDEKLMISLNKLREYIRKEYDPLNIAPSKEWLTGTVEQFFHPKSGKAKTLNEFIKAYIIEAKRQDRKNKDTMNFTMGTIRSWEGFNHIFHEYQGLYDDDRRKGFREIKKYSRPVKILDFDDIDLTFCENFKTFLSNEGYKPNTTGRFIKILKYFMQKSLEERLHNNRDFQNRNVFKVISEPAFSIYLTDDEIDRIYNYDLSKSPGLELARDVFITLCETALRVSDYPQIGIDIRNKNGGKLMYITQTKTGGEVILPLSQRMEEILNKYNGSLPFISDVLVNRYIKIIAKQCGIDEKLTWEASKFGKKYTKTAHKWQLITCHTGRRSACTNLYKAGIPTLDIMQISGHSTETNFLKYIRISKEEVAERLALHPYFRRNRLKII